MDILGLFMNEGMPALEKIVGPITWPVTWIADDQMHMAGGIQIWAESDANITPIILKSDCVGTLIDTPDTRIVRLGGLNGRIPTRTHVEQTNASLHQMIDALQMANMDFSNVVRTWFYNCDIVSWYHEFNETRDQFFSTHNIYEGLIPASTGIGACNVSGSSIVTGLLALSPKSDAVAMSEISSPLQCPATDYGSSFSRAVEIGYPSYRQLLISGTASIDFSGRTIHKNEIEEQIFCTMEVVKALLESRKMGWANVTRAIAYLKHARDIPRFESCQRELGLDDLSVIILSAEICRSDLLFEIELDAIAVNPGD
jgi:enamine deaminase RidA (YjgF/YER057c/UK114 family)